MCRQRRGGWLAGLRLRGAAPHAAIAAANSTANDAHRYFTATARLARDANEMWTAFGPTNVRLHAISAAIALHNAAEALASRPAQLQLDLSTTHAHTADSDWNRQSAGRTRSSAPRVITIRWPRPGSVYAGERVVDDGT